MKVCTVAVFAVATLTEFRAEAAPPHPIKAEFLCGTYVDGKIKDVVTSGKRPKLSDPIACAIHVPDTNEPSHMGNIHTVRHPSGGKAIATSGKTSDFGSQSDDDKKDFEIVMQPAIADQNGDVLFQPCEDFDIVATISDDLGVYFTRTLKIEQTCPKPKPIAVSVKCTQADPDGKKPVVFGATPKERWPEATIECELRSKDPRLTESTTNLIARSVWTDFEADGHPQRTADTAGSIQQMPEVPAFQAVYLDPKAWFACSPVDITLKLVDGAGATVFTQTIKTKHTCGE